MPRIIVALANGGADGAADRISTDAVVKIIKFLQARIGEVYRD